MAADPLHRQIQRSVDELMQTVENLSNEGSDVGDIAPAPAAPDSLKAAGLQLHQLSSLILKLVYLHGTLTGFEIAKEVRLPFTVVDEGLEFLKREHCAEVTRGDTMGRISQSFVLTEAGRTRARAAFDECRYVGPAPVSLESYTAICRQQAVRHLNVDARQIQSAFRGLVVDNTLLRRLGPAIASGLSLFLYGPTGNGKTVFSKAIGRCLHEFGSSIYVPYAVHIDSQIVTVFDPSLHQQVPSDTRLGEGLTESTNDQRWLEIKRPFITAGGEFSLDMLELRYHPSSGYYQAPLHMKANGGTFLLDDFGRQLIPPRELLNRWILPLEERHDYLTLMTGKKILVPFEELVVFSTNLAPADLVDAAFLRRIRHKIEIPPPTEAQYRAIFQKECERRAIKYDDWIVSQVLTQHYNQQNQPKSSDPRDLLDVLEGICRFKETKPHLSEELIAEAFQNCLSLSVEISA